MKVRAVKLEDRCLGVLASGPKTPEEAREIIAAELGAVVLLTSIRPRFSALARRGLVCDSGERGLGEGGRCKAIRWRLTTPDERQAWAARDDGSAE